MSIKFFKLFLIFLIPSLFACSKNDGDGTFMSAKIDGKSYKAEGLFAYGVKFSGELVFYGIVGDDINKQQSLLVRVPLSAKEGDSFTSLDDIRFDYTDSNLKNFTSHLSKQAKGNVKLTKLTDTTAEGTFEAIIYDNDTDKEKRTLTDGNFSVVFR